MMAAGSDDDRASLYYYVAARKSSCSESVRDVLSQNLEAAEQVKKQKGTAPKRLQALIERHDRVLSTGLSTCTCTARTSEESHVRTANGRDVSRGQKVQSIVAHSQQGSPEGSRTVRPSRRAVLVSGCLE